ncbi:hypothetical protein [Echinicola rosea]|uniref:hypothetical protein n=1 Tax=Echinicola rosea TaxID=1807691 RepID=UPI0010CA716E|nr:hypothetical protein [Echinicola rosea]
MNFDKLSWSFAQLDFQYKALLVSIGFKREFISARKKITAKTMRFRKGVAHGSTCYALSGLFMLLGFSLLRKKSAQIIIICPINTPSAPSFSTRSEIV